MPAQLRRLNNPVQTIANTALTLFTVPANTQYILKSLYIANARTDKQILNNSLTVVPAVGPAMTVPDGQPQPMSLMANRTLAPLEVQAKEFAVLVFEPGDSLVLYGSISGSWIHTHGLVVTV